MLLLTNLEPLPHITADIAARICTLLPLTTAMQRMTTPLEVLRGLSRCQPSLTTITWLRYCVTSMQSASWYDTWLDGSDPTSIQPDPESLLSNISPSLAIHWTVAHHRYMEQYVLSGGCDMMSLSRCCTGMGGKDPLRGHTLRDVYSDIIGSICNPTCGVIDHSHIYSGSPASIKIKMTKYPEYTTLLCDYHFNVGQSYIDYAIQCLRIDKIETTVPNVERLSKRVTYIVKDLESQDVIFLEHICVPFIKNLVECSNTGHQLDGYSISDLLIPFNSTRDVGSLMAKFPGYARILLLNATKLQYITAMTDITTDPNHYQPTLMHSFVKMIYNIDSFQEWIRESNRSRLLKYQSTINRPTIIEDDDKLTYLPFDLIPYEINGTVRMAVRNYTVIDKNNPCYNDLQRREELGEEYDLPPMPGPFSHTIRALNAQTVTSKSKAKNISRIMAF